MHAAWEWDWPAVEAIATGVGVFLAGAGAIYAVLQLRVSARASQLTALTETMAAISSADARNARRVVYAQLSPDSVQYEPDYKGEVTAMFDNFGALVTTRLVNPNLFLTHHYEAIIRCWLALEAHVKRRRERDPRFGMHFEALVRRAKEYGATHYPGRPVGVYIGDEAMTPIAEWIPPEASKRRRAWRWFKRELGRNRYERELARETAE